MTLERSPIATSRIAFIQASWHKEIVDQSRTGFLSQIQTLGYAVANVEVFTLPGAFEIPLHAKLLAQSGKYQAIVAAGLVVDGGIYRHDFVAQSVVSGLMQVQLETQVPVFSVVLTPHHFHAGDEHQQFFLTTSISRAAKPPTRWPRPCTACGIWRTAAAASSPKLSAPTLPQRHAQQ
jgi:6,7-dimethyl-8-ribityllumazine synthase